MKKWIASLFLALPLAAGAQETTPAAGTGTPEKASFEKVTFPFEGEISADRLYVRMSPSTGEKSVIATLLASGDKVTVVGEKEGFYQILPTKGCAVWVFARNFKREGDTATALNDSTPVRLDSRVNAPQVGTLNAGDTVKVLREHMGWFSVEAPHSVPYFVGAKHVRMMRALDAAAAGISLPEGAGAPATTVVREEDAEALAKVRAAESMVESQNRLLEERRVKELNYREVIRTFEEAQTLAMTDPVKTRIESSLHLYRELQKALDAMSVQLMSLDEVLRRQRELKTGQQEEIRKSFAFTGYVDTVGMLWKRPGAYQIVMGGKTLCFLKPRDGDEEMIGKLKWHYKEYVGVNGTIVKDPEGWPGSTLVVVEEIVPLTVETK